VLCESLGLAVEWSGVELKWRNLNPRDLFTLPVSGVWQGVKLTMVDVNPFKEIFLLALLNILLPTVDVYSDLALVTKLYYNGHPKWASLLLVPFLVNYTLCWIAWFTTEKQRKFTWIAALLGCYPQLVAARIIWLFWTQPVKGMREKKHLERNLMEHEIFTEAVPTALIMTFLMVVTIDDQSGVVIGEGLSEILFFVSFTTSALSAGLGLAKCLKVGPCRVLAEGGCLGGLLAPRFLLIFVACLLSLLVKGVALGSPFTSRLIYRVLDQKLRVTAIILATMFLPGFLLGLVSCWHRGILKTLIAHPSIILMPTFTHFTFASSTQWCKGSSNKEGEKEEGGDTEESFITFSAKFTFLNVGASVICSVVYGLSLTQLAGWNSVYDGRDRVPDYLAGYLLVGVPFFILGLLLTLLTLASTSTRPNVEYGALLPTSLHAHYVLGANGKPELILGDEEVKSEETEMVKTEMVNTEKGEKIDNQDDETVDFK